MSEDIHPLDREDNDPVGRSPYMETSQKPHSILRTLVIVAILFGVLVMISSVAMNNTTYGSMGYQATAVIQRLLMTILLAAFLGMLAYYQRNNLKKFIQRFKSPSLQQPRTEGALTLVRSKDKNSLVILAAMNVGLLVFFWLAAIASSALSWQLPLKIMSYCHVLAPGLLVCMIVWHRGPIRAYAIGALATLAFSFYFIISSIIPMTFGARQYGSYQYQNLSWDYEFAFQSTMIVVGGLIPAFYVRAIMWLTGGPSSGDKSSELTSEQNLP